TRWVGPAGDAGAGADRAAVDSEYAGATSAVSAGLTGWAAATVTPRLSTCTANAAATARRTTGTLRRSASWRTEPTQAAPCAAASATTTSSSRHSEPIVHAHNSHAMSNSSNASGSTGSVEPESVATS